MAEHAKQDSHRLNHWVHYSLLAGSSLSALVLLAGMILTLTMHQERPQGPPPGLGTLLHQVTRADGVALLDLGLLILMCTPILRVVVLGIGWLAGGDRRFAMVAFVVLALLLASLFLGVG